MTNKLWLAGISVGLVVSVARGAVAGNYVQILPTAVPQAADIGTVSETMDWKSSVTTPQGPRNIVTKYRWQWHPNNNDRIADPAPSQHITHSYVLGGGPLTAEWNGIAADASGDVYFTSVVLGDLVNAQQLHFNVKSGIDYPGSSQSEMTSIPHSTQTHAEPNAATPYFAPVYTVDFLETDIQVIVSGIVKAKCTANSSSATATISGSIKSIGATLSP